MRLPLQITYRDIRHSDALEARIRANAAKLDQFHSSIMSCHLTVGEAGRHQARGRQFEVRIDLRAAGRREVLSTHSRHEDVYVAVRDAFDAARRQVLEAARERRGGVKRHRLPQHGRVSRVYADEGFGFIETADGREFYFGRENVADPPFEHLLPGTEVQFIEEVAGEGFQAHRVSAGKHHF